MSSDVVNPFVYIHAASATLLVQFLSWTIQQEQYPGHSFKYPRAALFVVESVSFIIYYVSC